MGGVVEELDGYRRWVEVEPQGVLEQLVHHLMLVERRVLRSAFGREGAAQKR